MLKRVTDGAKFTRVFVEYLSPPPPPPPRPRLLILFGRNGARGIPVANLSTSRGGRDSHGSSSQLEENIRMKRDGGGSVNS